MLTGTASIDELSAHISTLESFDTPGASLRDVEVLQSLFEIRIGGRQASLPSGLHPTNPPTFIFQFWNCPDSEWGPFRLAQGRVGCRSGLRPRAASYRAACATTTKRRLRCVHAGASRCTGAVTLRHHYDAVEVLASVDGHVVLSMRGKDPEPLGNGDVAYSSTVALAHTPRGLRLVQIEYDVTVTRAERLHPQLDEFDAAGFGVHPTVEPYRRCRRRSRSAPSSCTACASSAAPTSSPSPAPSRSTCNARRNGSDQSPRRRSRSSSSWTKTGRLSSPRNDGRAEEPPSTASTWPVIQLAWSDSRNITAYAMSSGVPRRPNGSATRSAGVSAGGAPAEVARGADGARRHRVHPDARASQLECRGVHERVHPAFAAA